MALSANEIKIGNTIECYYKENKEWVEYSVTFSDFVEAIAAPKKFNKWHRPKKLDEPVKVTVTIVYDGFRSTKSKMLLYKHELENAESITD